MGGAVSSAVGKALGAVGRSLVSDIGSLDTEGVAGACGADEESLCTTEVGKVGGGTVGSGVEGAAASIGCTSDSFTLDVIGGRGRLAIVVKIVVVERILVS